MKVHYYLILCLFFCSHAAGQTVTDVSAEYHDGQIFITWENIPDADTGFYYVYKNTVPITSANIQNSAYLGRVLFNFGYDYRFTYAAIDHLTRYLVTNDNPHTQLDSTQNLFVMNCTEENVPLYFAVRCNYGVTLSLIH